MLAGFAGAKAVPNLISFQGVGAKGFQIQIRKQNLSPESFCFPVVSHHSTAFSARKLVLHAAVRVFPPSSGNGIKKLAMAKIFSLNKTLFTAW